MALQKQLLKLPIDKGLDTKVDSKQEAVGALRRAENLVYETVLKLRKRNGYDEVMLNILGGTESIQGAIKAAKYKKELLLFNSDAMYAYSDSLQGWAKKGTLYPTRSTSVPVNKNANSLSNQTCVVNSNILFAAWEDSSGGVRYSVQDLSTNSFIVSNKLVSSNGKNPRCGAIGNVIVLAHTEGSNIYVRTINLLDPSNLASATLIENDLDTELNLIDAATVSNKVFIAYQSDIGQVRLFSVDSSNTASGVVGVGAASATQALNITSDAQSRVIVSFANATRAAFFIHSFSLTALLLSVTTLELNTDVYNLTAIQTSLGQYRVFFEVRQEDASNTYVKKIDIDLAGATTGLSVLKRSVGLAGTAYRHNDTTFIPVVHDSTAQSTYFILDNAGNLVTKFANQQASGLINSGSLPKTQDLGTDEFLILNLIKNRLTSDTESFYSTSGLQHTLISYNQTDVFQNAELADSLHISSGVLKMYDGSSVVEHGFNVYPEVLQRATLPVDGFFTTITEGSSPSTSEVQLLKFTAVPQSGSFKINIEGSITEAIPFSATNSDVHTAVEALNNVVAATVTGSFASGFTITIGTPKRNFAPFTVVESSLAVFEKVTTTANAYVTTLVEGSTSPATSEVQLIKFDGVPSLGYFTIQLGSETTAKLYYNATASDIETAIEDLTTVSTATVTGSFADGFTITIDTPQQNFPQATIPTNTLKVLHDSNDNLSIVPTVSVIQEGSISVSEIQEITFDEVPNYGHWQITVGAETTHNLYYNATAAEVKSALEALTTITTATVVGSMTSGFLITIDSPLQNFATFIVAGNTLQQFVTGGLTAGNRAYVALYKWTDNTGKDHLSSPTLVPLTVITTSETSVALRVETLRITEKENVVIELYRTENNGTIFYKISDNNNPTYNDPTVDFVDVVDFISDADLISRETLYTTGGILENIAAPSTGAVTVYNNRLAVIGENENRVYFSKETSEGRPVEFTDLIYRDVDPTGGELTALVQMNDKLVIFAEDGVFFVTGQGPNNLLQQDDMTQPDRLSTDIGCLSADELVLTPAGILFKSRKGIWAISNGLQLSYVGAPVEAYNDQDVTSIQIVGELNQIRFILATERALVYNYNLDRWATFENHGGLSSIAIQNDYYYIRESGALYKENRASFSDATSTIKMRIETGWISFADLQGFARVYRAVILGAFKSLHKLRVRVAYNYVEAFVQETIVDPTQFVNPQAYGLDGNYGNGSPYGGNGNLYQMQINMQQQKCQSIKLLIEDAQDTPGEGLDLSSITLQVGVKEGTNKLPDENSFGTK